MPQNKDLKRLVRARMADIVLDVLPEAAELHFGALLSGAGAIDLTQRRFEETSREVPVTTTARPLPEEPQALDFGLTS